MEMENEETTRRKTDDYKNHSLLNSSPSELLYVILIYACYGQLHQYPILTRICKQWKLLLCPFSKIFYDADLYLSLVDTYEKIEHKLNGAWTRTNDKRITHNTSDKTYPVMAKKIRLDQVRDELKLLGEEPYIKEDMWEKCLGWHDENISGNGKGNYYSDIFELNCKLWIESFGCRMPFFIHTVTNSTIKSSPLMNQDCQLCRLHSHDYDDILCDINRHAHFDSSGGCASLFFTDVNLNRCFIVTWSDNSRGILLWIIVLRIQKFFQDRGVKCQVDTANIVKSPGLLDMTSHGSLNSEEIDIHNCHTKWVILRIPPCKAPEETIKFIQDVHKATKVYVGTYHRNMEWLYGPFSTLTPKYWVETYIGMVLSICSSQFDIELDSYSSLSLNYITLLFKLLPKYYQRAQIVGIDMIRDLMEKKSKDVKYIGSDGKEYSWNEQLDRMTQKIVMIIDGIWVKSINEKNSQQ